MSGPHGPIGPDMDQRLSELGHAVVGRAGPVRAEHPPAVPIEAGEELLVLKAGSMFVCTRPDGEIRPARVSGEGLYAHDTRFVSELGLELGRKSPVFLSYSLDAGSRAVIAATNPALPAEDGLEIDQQALSLRRTLVLDERLYYHVEVRSYWPSTVRTSLSLALAADFADMFEIRGERRPARGHVLAPRRSPSGAALAYLGEDHVLRRTRVRWDRRPVEVLLAPERLLAIWSIVVEPGQSCELLITATPSLGEQQVTARGLGAARRRLARSESLWRRRCTAMRSDNELFDRWLETAVADLHALMTPAGDDELPAAGVPWYVAPFGRDSLLTAYQTLLLNPQLARGTLTSLASLQAHEDDPWRDAEPGKILHELRTGELAGIGAIPHTPYYGTVDATPLFVALAANYFRWTGDLATVTALRPALDAALEWIDRWGDADGDGFIEYQRRSPAGLVNQGWKDSHDSIVHLDGRLAEGPIALVEAQAYVYLAKHDAAALYAALGLPERAAALRSEADALRRRFNEAFWDDDHDCYALALDGDKRQVRSVTSNAAHALFCGIADPEKAARLAERLMAPDMFSGWGIRTLSSQSTAYNPMSYHNGSVWPHDNAIAAAGLKRYGFDEPVERITLALFEVASARGDFRLPELFCGFERGDSSRPVGYPVACIPQAWAAATPIMLLQTLLGLSVDAPRTVTLTRPQLPSRSNEVELRGLSVGEARIGIVCRREGGVTACDRLDRRSDVDLVIAR